MWWEKVRFIEKYNDNHIILGIKAGEPKKSCGNDDTYTDRIGIIKNASKGQATIAITILDYTEDLRSGEWAAIAIIGQRYYKFVNHDSLVIKEVQTRRLSKYIDNIGGINGYDQTKAYTYVMNALSKNILSEDLIQEGKKAYSEIMSLLSNGTIIVPEHLREIVREI